MWISEKNGNSRRAESAQPTPTQRTKSSNGLVAPFPKSARILKRSAFKAIGQLRQRYRATFLAIDYRPSYEPKLGITVTRKFGNAVLRNQFKRRTREAFRLNRTRLPSCEIVILPQENGAVPTIEQITTSLLEFSQYAQSATTKSR